MSKNKKEKKDKNNGLLVVGLLLLVVVIGVGYAALQSTLNINGTANIGTNTWNIYFTNISVTNGSVTATTEPEVIGTSTTTLTYGVTLNQPGDFYEFTVDVVNGGTINAALSSQSLTGAEDYNFIKYTVTLADGSAVPSNLSLAGGNGTNPGGSTTLKVRVEYDRETVNTNNVSLTIPPLTLTYQMNFVQA